MMSSCTSSTHLSRSFSLSDRNSWTSPPLVMTLNGCTALPADAIVPLQLPDPVMIPLPLALWELLWGLGEGDALSLPEV